MQNGVHSTSFRTFAVKGKVSGWVSAMAVFVMVVRLFCTWRTVKSRQGGRNIACLLRWMTSSNTYQTMRHACKKYPMGHWLQWQVGSFLWNWWSRISLPSILLSLVATLVFFFSFDSHFGHPAHPSSPAYSVLAKGKSQKHTKRKYFSLRLSFSRLSLTSPFPFMDSRTLWQVAKG